jgi:hypothetical protein
MDNDQLITADEERATLWREVKKGGVVSILALFIVLIFAGTLGLVCWGGACNANSPTLNLLIGALIALVGQVGQYYFGSSLGSKKKTEMLDQEIKQLASGR